MRLRLIKTAIANYITSTRRISSGVALSTHRLALRERLRPLVFPKPADITELDVQDGYVYWVSDNAVTVVIAGQPPITIKEN